MNELYLLKRLSECFGPSTLEDQVMDIIKDELGPEFKFLQTTHKNLIVFRDNGNCEKTIVLQAHMDELGVRPYKYLPDGFIQLTPTGGIPKSANNQMIVFQPTGANGILLIQETAGKPLYFADVGAKDPDEARELVPHHSNGAYTGVIMEESSTQLKGKSFDDRAGCAAIVTALKNWDANSKNRMIGVFTAREETGNWPVTELYRTMMNENLLPDLIVNVECCPGGPTPGNPDPLAKLGEGMVLVNMDASYEPDPKICCFMEEISIKEKIPHQLMAIRDGSGELGRLALGFGVAGYPLTIPCRYMHSPHSVITKTDFQACIKLVTSIVKYF